MPSKGTNASARPLPRMTMQYHVEKYELPGETVYCDLSLNEESATATIRTVNPENDQRVTLSPDEAEALIPVLERLVAASSGHRVWYSEKEVEEMYLPPTPSPRKERTKA